ncbi:MAG: FAD-dependent oxidoreductase [Deltaproteobacteria bacterium]|nr:MAG: FAD-dependent oxidoreductase [Deltaproteobacteria bacterium]
MAKKEVLIVGGGPAGLVASINLVREGFEVTLADQEEQVGGNPDWHPSAHTTPLKGPATWEYIGIDCTPCFHDISESLTVVVGGESAPIERTAEPTFTCERGSRETSLDSFLYRIAVKEGVKFNFGTKIREEDLQKTPEHTILATGFTPAMYKTLEKPMSNYLGYHALCDHPPGEAEGCIYLGGLGKEYGYSSACNGLWYVLLFSRNELPQENLDYFADLVKKYEDKEIAEWRRFAGASPKSGPELIYKDRFILTGTLAGFIETNYGFGITGALISGKIAALAVTDRNRARAEFDSFTGGIPAMLEKKRKGQVELGFKLGKIWFEI